MIKDTSKKTRLSVSKLQTYLDCPRKYWYLYDVKVETPKSEGYFFGSAIHEGLENYYNKRDPLEAVKYSLFGKKTKITEKAKEGVDPYKLFSQAKRIFEVYEKKATKFQPILVEHWFDVDLENPKTKEKLPVRFVGKIDLITITGDIVDHKTTTNHTDNGFFDDENEFQSNGYAYAYFKMFNKMPHSFIFNTIIRGNTKQEPNIILKTLYPTTDNLVSFFDTCRTIQTAIEKKETSNHTNPKHCRFCPVKDICPKRT